MLAVELRPEEMGCPLEDLVGSLELPVLLLQRLHPRRVAATDPRHVALVDVPERKQDLVAGRYELPAPPAGCTVAVKIIDMLGEELVVTLPV